MVSNYADGFLLKIPMLDRGFQDTREFLAKRVVERAKGVDLYLIHSSSYVSKTRRVCKYSDCISEINKTDSDVIRYQCLRDEVLLQHNNIGIQVIATDQDGQESRLSSGFIRYYSLLSELSASVRRAGYSNLGWEVGPGGGAALVLS